MNQLSRASTQYNDLKGSIAIDFHGGGDTSLWSYAEEHDIDTDKYQPIGLSFYIGEHNTFSLRFICIDNEQHDSFKEENDGKVPLIIFRKDENLEDFLRQIKRFDAILRFKQDGFEPHEIVKEFDEQGNEF